jgi:hypothetical protein
MELKEWKQQKWWFLGVGDLALERLVVEGDQRARELEHGAHERVLEHREAVPLPHAHRELAFAFAARLCAQVGDWSWSQLRSSRVSTRSWTKVRKSVQLDAAKP